MYAFGNLQTVSQNEDGTTLELIVRGVKLLPYIVEKEVTGVELRIDDGRTITAEQRKKVYATVKDISDWSGYLPEEQKEWLKYLHISLTGCDYFSLSDCSITTAREFINTCIDYALEIGVPFSESAINRTDDIGRYLYSCLKFRKCAICGDNGEIHHVDTIGMGNDRKEIDDRDYRKICLCRTHHTMAHQYGMPRFEKAFKVYGIKFENT